MSRSSIDNHAATGKIFLTDHVIHFANPRDPLQAPAPGVAPPPGTPAPDDATFRRRITPDQVLLFRYSALIFYGHRIHYDLDYTRLTEGYPGLVVHGPLSATLLVDLALEQLGIRQPKAFTISANAPLFGPEPFWLEGRETERGAFLWARRPDDTLAMTVTLETDP